MAKLLSLTSGLLVLFALTSGVEASCLNNCNVTNTICNNNWVVDKYICQQGMDRCVTRCFNNSTFNNNTWASNCTEIMDYCPYVSNWTCRDMINRCARQAFQPKISWNWSAWECGYQCGDASGLCNYTNYIDWYQCKNWTNGCFDNCYNYDFDNYNPYNPWNNTNWTNSFYGNSFKPSTRFIRSSVSHGGRHGGLDEITCMQCQDISGKVETIIKQSGCGGEAFEQEVTKIAAENFPESKHA